jgi:Fe-S-cluster-containing hydrogenase component 2
MPKRLAYEGLKCTGCRMCELACSMHHEGKFAPEKARVKVARIGLPEIPVPVLQKNCDHCKGDPACVKYCAYGVISYREDNPREERGLTDAQAMKMAQDWLKGVMESGAGMWKD